MTLNSVLKRSMGAAALTLAASMAASPAHAISGSMSWDPYYGQPFVGPDGIANSQDDMYWSGTGTYNLDGCSLPLNGKITVHDCSTMYVNNVVVNLAVGQQNSTDEIFFEQLRFNGEVQIFEAEFLNGNLVSIYTDYFDPWVRASEKNFKVNLYDFSLSFEFGGATLYHAKGDGDYKHDHGHDDSEEFWKGLGKGHLAQYCSSDPTTFKKSNEYCGFSAEKATVTFAPIASIPEPHTYALMLVGLAAMGFVTRRRRQG